MPQEIIAGEEDALVFGPVVSAVDHNSAVTGLSAFDVLNVSVAGSAFAPLAATIPSGLLPFGLGVPGLHPPGIFTTSTGIAEVGNGYYSIPAAALGNYPTVGPLVVHAEVSGADDLDQHFWVKESLHSPTVEQAATATPLPFLLLDENDHLTGLTGATPTVTISKAGGEFAAPTGTVEELGHGVYALVPSAADLDTPGPLVIQATATGADDATQNYHVTSLPTTPDVPGVFAAILETLRSEPTVVAAFEDDAVESPKFWADLAPATWTDSGGTTSPLAMPLLIYSDVSASPAIYATDGSFIEEFVFQINVMATGKRQVRNLAKLAAQCVQDAPLEFDDGSLLRLRQTKQFTDVADEDGGPGGVPYFKTVTEFTCLVHKRLS